MKISKLSILAVAVLALWGCDGDDGKDGTNGADGKNGTDGQNGQNSLVSQRVLTVGNLNCPNGGIQINSGIDKNGDGSLSGDEVTQSNNVCAQGTTSMTNTLKNKWFTDGQAEIKEAKQTWIAATANVNAKAKSTVAGSAKNVILFVGDGMGISTVTAARILAGQMAGGMGEDYQLSFEKMPFAGLSKTYNVDAQTPDSAGTMTAMVSGVKTDVGVIGVDEDIVRGDCSTVAGNELVTALELAEIAGKSTGIVSTARITHATPAATYAKSADRNWEDVSDMPEAAVTAGCKDIADQLVNFESYLEARIKGTDVNGLEVVMGGGRRHFLPKDASANSPDARSSVEGDRTDQRNLVEEWKAKYTDGVYVYDQTGFDAIDTEATEHLFGLFNESHMQYEADRKNDVAGEPSMTQMTETAINVLNNNDKGFFLMVESGRIDHGHHAGSAYNALTDTIEFAKAIEKAMSMTSSDDTLIIVTADHGHVFTIAGYPKRGNPILGHVVSVGKTEPQLAKDNMPYTTLGYTNGRGYFNLGSETNADKSYGLDINAGRFDTTGIDTATPGYHQEALIPGSSETHSGEDVGIHASGPGAYMVNSTLEQSMIFHVMNYAGGLVDAANAKVSGAK